jgi:hypothetical protein
MSRVQKNKKRQGYQRNPLRPMCSNCINYKFKLEKPAYASEFSLYVEEKDKRCSVGDFVVLKTALCKLHEFREDAC